MDQAVILVCHVRQGLGHDAFGINLFLLVGLGNEVAMEVVERLVGNDARGHVHDVTLGDGLRLAVGVEGDAKEVEGSLGSRGGESNKQLVEVVLADDLGNLFVRVWERRLGVGFVRFAEGQPDGGAHLAFLRPVGLINQEGHSQFLELRVALKLLENPRKLLLGGDDDGLALSEEQGQIIGPFLASPTTSFRWVKFSMSSRILCRGRSGR